MAGQVIPFQFQFDVVGGAKLTADFFSYILTVCAEDDLQAVALEPLELFGGLLMADPARVQQGVDALKQRSTVWWRAPLQVRTPRAATLVADNARLTSVFLFATACSTCMSISSASKIVYEMMTLNGLIKKHPITSEVVLRFLKTINGSRDDFIAQNTIDRPNPIHVFERLGHSVELAYRSLRPDVSRNLGMFLLYEDNKIQHLADLLYRVFEAAGDENNKRIELEGHRSGVFVAFVLIWMRPAEVTVLLGDKQVYPWTDIGLSRPQLTDRSNLRITVQLLSSHGMPRDRDGSVWSFKVWQNAWSATEPIFVEDNHRHKLTANFVIPWLSARSQLALGPYKHHSDLLPAIGQVAAALVVASTEWGYVTSNDMKERVLLKDICPEWYLQEYPTIIMKMGWNDLSSERVQDLMVAGKELWDEMGQGSGLEYFILRWIARYEERFGAFLPRNRDYTSQNSPSFAPSEVPAHAIHLAAHILRMVIFHELPTWTTYKHLDQQERSKSKQLLSKILSGHTPLGGLELLELRAGAISAMLPTARSFEASDLAQAGEGYVIFRSALVRETYEGKGSTSQDVAVRLDDRREVGTYQIFTRELQEDCRLGWWGHGYTTKMGSEGCVLVH